VRHGRLLNNNSNFDYTSFRGAPIKVVVLWDSVVGGVILDFDPLSEGPPSVFGRALFA
jgi:hypothetical protein